MKGEVEKGGWEGGSVGKEGWKGGCKGGWEWGCKRGGEGGCEGGVEKGGGVEKVELKKGVEHEGWERGLRLGTGMRKVINSSFISNFSSIS